MFCIKTDELHAAKILGISWYPGLSHQEVFRPVWKELSMRGHQVTIITPVPFKDKSLTNLTEIDISFLFNVRKQCNSLELFSKDRYTWPLVKTVRYYLLEIFEQMLESREVQSLIHSKEKFDVIVGEVQSELVFAFGERFKVPVVGKSVRYYNRNYKNETFFNFDLLP